MALIENLKEGYKEKEQIHRTTECCFFIITDKEGRKYLQIDTYGSDSRAIPGKVSQSIQFSPNALEQLKEILMNKF